MKQPAAIPATAIRPDPRWALFMDVDGTLLPIADTPDGVARNEAVCRLLARLRQGLEGAVALISGRTIEKLDRLFAPLRLPVAGLHGLEHRDARGHLSVLGEAETLDHLRAPLAELAAAHEGLLLEDKGRALAFHYRLAPDQGARVEKTIISLVGSTQDLRLIHGKMVIEIKPRHADKGSAVRAFMAEAPFQTRIPVFLGDDVTDEDAFEAINALDGISIHVGVSRNSAARYRLDDVGQVLRWLTCVADSLEAAGEEQTS